MLACSPGLDCSKKMVLAGKVEAQPFIWDVERLR